MTRDEAVALIAFRLGDRTDLNDRIIAEMRLAQTELELGPTLPWFLLTEMATATLYEGDDTMALPADFLREVDEDESALWFYKVDADSDYQWVEVPKKGFHPIRTELP